MKAPKEIKDAIIEMETLLAEINKEMKEKRKLASFINNPREVQELYIRQWWCMSKIEALKWVLHDSKSKITTNKKLIS